MNELFIGTSGYDYDEWKGIFYPDTIKKKEYLSYYATIYNALELNFSYYQMPTENQMYRMIERTDKKVHFTIKGNKQFTHEIDPYKWKDITNEFIKIIYPLIKDNLLLSVLLQFPNGFEYDIDNRKYLARLIDIFNDVPLIVEFRHKSWQQESVYNGLHEKNVGLCITDMPKLKDLPEFKPIITSDKSYFRFHGRNNENWAKTNARDRYDYLYNDNELKLLCPIIKDVIGKSKLVQIYFNNHAKGNATVNSQKLKIMLNEII
jgi:uncharacterized protein YecE (DUF72 family)